MRRRYWSLTKSHRADCSKLIRLIGDNAHSHVSGMRVKVYENSAEGVGWALHDSLYWALDEPA